MKIFFIYLLFLLPLHSISQQIIFCEGVDKSGNPKGPSKEFSIGAKGGFVKVLVRLTEKVDVRSVVFDVYRMDTKEILENSITMEVNPALTWFYKEITFFKEGDYRVYVYDERDKLLGLGELKIRLR